MKRRAQVPVPLAVLMYHDVADSLDGVPPGHRPYVVLTPRFSEQMDALAIRGIGATSLVSHLDDASSPGAASDRCCVITFDDGHESNCTHALPILVKHRFRATFFVTTGWVGRARYMNWNQIRALADAGMEVGSHSVTHRPPASLSRAELLAEMLDSKRMLEDQLGIPIATASSPTGFFNPGMIAAARDAGYRALCYGRIALWSDPGHRFAIPRIPVKLDMTTADLLRIAGGDSKVIASLRRRQALRDVFKRILGPARYLGLRRALIGILGPNR